MINKIKGIFADEEGQGMTEYGLALGIIVFGTLFVLTALQTQISELIIRVTGIVSDSAASVFSSAH